MTKTELLDRCSRNSDERLLLARALDQAEKVHRRSVPGHTGFLNPDEQMRVRDALRLYGDVRYVSCGGYEAAERALCLFLPDWMEETDVNMDADGAIAAVQATVYKDAAISHRDVLGALMGLGITREKIGDICLSGTKAQVVLLSDVRDIVLGQWEGIGRYAATPEAIELSDLQVKLPEIKEIVSTVATLRLDSVLATGFSLSRSKASELIAAGRVSVNYRECTKTDKSISEGDILSCRGLGKCVLREAGAVSRKGRVIIKIDRFI